jgi:drug/metabolite transporter (DMT)-like permease
MSQGSSDELPGYLAAFTVSVIWGLSFVAARMVLSTLSPVLLATLRFVIASLIFTPVILREIRAGYGVNLGGLRELALMGLLSVSVYFWLQYTGVKYAGAGVSALLVVGFIPILTGVTSSILVGEGLGRREAAGAFLGFLGVVLVAIPGLALDFDPLFLIGVVCLLLNAVCWASYSALSRRLMSRLDRPLLVTSYVTVLGTLALLPMSATSDWGAVLRLQPVQWVSVLYLALVCSGLGYFLWNYALSRLEAVRAAIWLYMEPVAAFVGEALIFGQMPPALTILGGLLIVVGALTVSIRR